jgi:drug/metabolite transporter (DMT)-like permease
MTSWLLIFLTVASTAGGDVLQSMEMKRHPRSSIGSATRKVFQRPLLLLSIGCMAISFFSFALLLRIADLSFAVPATAASYVVETLLAKSILKERVDRRRWTGALLVASGVALLAV